MFSSLGRLDAGDSPRPAVNLCHRPGGGREAVALLTALATPAFAQDAKTAIANASKAMGADGVTSVTYYGSGANYNLGHFRIDLLYFFFVRLVLVNSNFFHTIFYLKSAKNNAIPDILV